jgi:hypothetical protein
MPEQYFQFLPKRAVFVAKIVKMALWKELWQPGSKSFVKYFLVE